LALATVGLALAAAAAVPARAQSGWSWPWESPKKAPEPVYRPPLQPAPGAQPVPGPYVSGNRPAICVQLESRLALEVNRGTSSRDVLPKLEADLRLLDRQIQQTQSQLDRADCYEYFLFSKSLKRTRACVDMHGQLEAAKRKFADMSTMRQQMLSSSGRSYQDEIIRELARNNCGASYQREASRQSPFGSIWQDEEGGSYTGGGFGALPFATYRTLCVRLCDGYYFPVSFSTLPNQFDRDDEVCRSRCAAPAELYYYQNPGGAPEQMVSHRTRQPYASLKTAMRYRKEFVQGCSCKEAEYVPAPGAPGGPPEKRTEVPSATSAIAARAQPPRQAP
jgi:hypothetical protein